jgi:Fe-S cluster assembly scaffold protein SufB
LECRGLLIDDEALIQSIPELKARKRGAEITHEAAVGKISEKEITYLMTRKLSRDQVVSLIIRGVHGREHTRLAKCLKREDQEASGSFCRSQLSPLMF